MKKYIINGIIGLLSGFLYVRGMYITALFILTFFNIIECIITKKNDIKNNFDLLNTSGLSFLLLVITNGIIKIKLNFIEILLVVCIGFDLLSIWIIFELCFINIIANISNLMSKKKIIYNK